MMSTRELSKRLDEVFSMVFAAIDGRIDARLIDIAGKLCPPATKKPSPDRSIEAEEGSAQGPDSALPGTEVRTPGSPCV